MEEKFSLKDYLFNKPKIEALALEIKKVYPEFNSKNFIKSVVEKFPELALKQRITWIAENLRKYLPKDFKEASNILLKSLPPENDNSKTDNDFGEFILAPYNEFIAKYGLDFENLEFSLNALKEITKRFSAEDAIRYFINKYPKETLKEIEKWSKDVHYHLRRLASEGTRPKLPWSPKINIKVSDAIHILDNLYFDSTRYVTRSVANHLNDISKSNPELVLKTLTRWTDSGKQNESEMEYITKHSLRNLVKLGNKQALIFLNFSEKPEIKVVKFVIKNKKVLINTFLEFELEIKALKNERILVDYLIHFANKDGKISGKKVFKIKHFELEKNQVLKINKRHKLRENMTTRKIYPGPHLIEIQINGEKLIKENFEVVSK